MYSYLCNGIRRIPNYPYYIWMHLSTRWLHVHNSDLELVSVAVILLVLNSLNLRLIYVCCVALPILS